MRKNIRNAEKKKLFQLFVYSSIATNSLQTFSIPVEAKVSSHFADFIKKLVAEYFAENMFLFISFFSLNTLANKTGFQNHSTTTISNTSDRLR